jgi:hypothetical protein
MQARRLLQVATRVAACGRLGGTVHNHNNDERPDAAD